YAMLVAAHAHVLDRAGDGEKKEPRAKDDDQHAEERHVRLPREQGRIEAESRTPRLTHKCGIAVRLFRTNRLLLLLLAGFISTRHLVSGFFFVKIPRWTLIARPRQGAP